MLFITRGLVYLFVCGSIAFAGSGNHAAVFYPRLAATASADGAVAVSSLLGCAMAHELAHLILHSTRHGDGVMRADWRPEELEMARQRRLLFNAADAGEL